MLKAFLLGFQGLVGPFRAGLAQQLLAFRSGAQQSPVSRSSIDLKGLFRAAGSINFAIDAGSLARLPGIVAVIKGRGIMQGINMQSLGKHSECLCLDFLATTLLVIQSQDDGQYQWGWHAAT